MSSGRCGAFSSASLKPRCLFKTAVYRVRFAFCTKAWLCMWSFADAGVFIPGAKTTNMISGLSSLLCIRQGELRRCNDISSQHKRAHEGGREGGRQFCRMPLCCRTFHVTFFNSYSYGFTYFFTIMAAKDDSRCIQRSNSGKRRTNRSMPSPHFHLCIRCGACLLLHSTDWGRGVIR